MRAWQSFPHEHHTQPVIICSPPGKTWEMLGFGLEGTLKLTSPALLQSTWTSSTYIMMLTALSNLIWNDSRGGASATSLLQSLFLSLI